jgi:Calcineurin-like phosphoesterase
MSNPKRKSQDYLDLSRWEIQNFFRTKQSSEENLSVEKTSIKHAIQQFLKQNFIGWFGSYLKNRFGPRHPFKTYEGLEDKGIYAFENTYKMTLLSDWATNTEEAAAIAKLSAKQQPDCSIHLGDIYFVGNEEEIINNFDPKNNVWQYGKKGSLALPGNHEFYANGDAFYQVLLPRNMGILNKNGNRMLQKTSFFCLENAHWRVIGLDTGFHSSGIPLLEFIPFFSPDCSLHKKQLEWLENEVKINDPDDKRGIIFLGHHQYYCAFDRSYPKQGEQLKKIMAKAARPVLWFWGHEHFMGFYDKNAVGNGIEAYGRCIGNGGMPVELKKELDLGKVKASGLKYFDGRVRKTIKYPRLFGLGEPKNIEIGFNGFASLTFDGATLNVTYIDQNNTTIMEEKWQANEQGEVIQTQEKPSDFLKKYAQTK